MLSLLHLKKRDADRLSLIESTMLHLLHLKKKRCNRLSLIESTMLHRYTCYTLNIYNLCKSIFSNIQQSGVCSADAKSSLLFFGVTGVTGVTSLQTNELSPLHLKKNRCNRCNSEIKKIK